MTEITLIILLAFAAYSLFSKAISRSFITLPILFTVLGYAMSQTLTASAPPELIHEGKKLLAEVTLVLVLFSDASHVRFSKLAAQWTLPARMLIIGMPLTIALGTLIAYVLNPTSGLAMALFTAAVLTPTDAALGQSVVSSPKVPLRLGQTINVESGLNDGLALPFVLLGAILASAALGDNGHSTQGLALEALQEVVLGPLVGVAVGWLAARAMDWAQDRDYMNEAAGAVVFLVAAFAAFALAASVGGNGFIAAFAAGMAFGNTYRHNIHFISEFMEGAGQILTMAAFLVFGAFLLPNGLAHATGTTILLALLFLTVVRMLPIFVSLAGSGLPTSEKLFLGWFGPRGLASILFTLLMIDQFNFPNEEEFLACVSLTVGLSILLHGLSATPLSNYFGKAGPS
jgi:NhaP-type Na+/H+ or K+/H+ antiporter